jgi:hypothetical protein
VGWSAVDNVEVWAGPIAVRIDLHHDDVLYAGTHLNQYLIEAMPPFVQVKVFDAGHLHKGQSLMTCQRSMGIMLLRHQSLSAVARTAQKGLAHANVERGAFYHCPIGAILITS